MLFLIHLKLSITLFYYVSRKKKTEKEQNKCNKCHGVETKSACNARCHKAPSEFNKKNPIT